MKGRSIHNKVDHGDSIWECDLMNFADVTDNNTKSKVNHHHCCNTLCIHIFVYSLVLSQFNCKPSSLIIKINVIIVTEDKTNKDDMWCLPVYTYLLKAFTASIKPSNSSLDNCGTSATTLGACASFAFITVFKFLSLFFSVLFRDSWAFSILLFLVVEDEHLLFWHVPCYVWYSLENVWSLDAGLAQAAVALSSSSAAWWRRMFDLRKV